MPLFPHSCLTVYTNCRLYCYYYFESTASCMHRWSAWNVSMIHALFVYQLMRFHPKGTWNEKCKIRRRSSVPSPFPLFPNLFLVWRVFIELLSGILPRWIVPSFSSLSFPFFIVYISRFYGYEDASQFAWKFLEQSWEFILIIAAWNSRQRFNCDSRNYFLIMELQLIVE